MTDYEKSTLKEHGFKELSEVTDYPDDDNELGYYFEDDNGLSVRTGAWTGFWYLTMYHSSYEREKVQFNSFKELIAFLDA